MTRGHQATGRRAERGSDTGSGTVLVLVVASLVLLAGSVLAALMAVGVARHRSAAVADLAALAAASAARNGAAPACAAAERVASASGATLLSCRLIGDVAQVQAQVRPPGPLARLGAATAQARAGPATPAQARAGPVASRAPPRPPPGA